MKTRSSSNKSIAEECNKNVEKMESSLQMSASTKDRVQGAGHTRSLLHSRECTFALLPHPPRGPGTRQLR